MPANVTLNLWIPAGSCSSRIILFEMPRGSGKRRRKEIGGKRKNKKKKKRKGRGRKKEERRNRIRLFLIGHVTGNDGDSGVSC